MTADKEWCEEVLERLEPLGDVTGKRLFSGYGYWEAGDMFALVDGEGVLYFKVDDDTIGRYRKAKAKPFEPRMASGRSVEMRYWSVPKAVQRDDDRFTEWARDAIVVGHATAKPKRKKKPKVPPAG